MEYSKIKTFRIKNFRNIGDVTIDFTESPIITLIGENESGKTSVVKAFAVTHIHADPKDQKSYIRDGTNGFGTVTELEDGHIITRIKNNSVNLYAVNYTDGNVWETKTIDGGLPVQVQELMGIVEEPETRQYLQIRTYEDQLLFAVTPASANYKVMYNALKVEQLTNSIKNGSNEVNELESSINRNLTKIETLLQEIRKIRLYDLEPITNIKNRIIKELQQIGKIEKALEMARRVTSIKSELGALANIQKAGIGEIDLVEVNKLMSVNRKLEKLRSVSKSLQMYKEFETIKSIDLALSEKLESTMNKKRVLSRVKNRSEVYRGIEGIDYIDTKETSQLLSAVGYAKILKDINTRISSIDVSNCKSINNEEVELIHKILKAIAVKNQYTNKNIELKAIDTGNAVLISESDISVTEKALKVITMSGVVSRLGKEIADINTEKARINQLIKESGALVADCTNCGESVVVDARAYA